MFAWLKMLDPKVWMAIALFVAFAAYTGAVYHAGGVGPRARLDTFKAEVRAAGEAQAKAAKVEDARNKERWRLANEENARTKSALTIALNSLRHNRPSSSFVPGAAPGSKRPDLACYDRSEFVGALGGFIEGARGLADEGTAGAVDLNTARKWAQSPKEQP